MSAISSICPSMENNLAVGRAKIKSDLCEKSSHCPAFPYFEGRTAATMRKTKIIATLGPATESPEMLGKLIDAGLSIARFNMSHGTHPWVRRVVDDLRSAAQSRGRTIGIL